MSNTNTGGPAFPIVIEHEKYVHAEGMTLRDYFAAKALQGMLAENGGGAVRNETLAEFAYDIADAMLKAREA
jgi:hypothetical protein